MGPFFLIPTLPSHWRSSPLEVLHPPFSSQYLFQYEIVFSCLETNFDLFTHARSRDRAKRDKRDKTRPSRFAVIKGFTYKKETKKLRLFWNEKRKKKEKKKPRLFWSSHKARKVFQKMMVRYGH